MRCRSDSSGSEYGEPGAKVGGGDSTKDIKHRNGAKVWRVEDKTFERVELATLARLKILFLMLDSSET